MNSPMIDFRDLGSEGVHVFAGRERGKGARERSHLEELDELEAPVEVLIPEDTMSVSSSFFLGMFDKSIVKLGEERFRSHYLFKGRDISTVIDDGIREALSTESPI